MSLHCKYRMEINRQIGLVHVVWIWNRNLGNVVPNPANFFILCCWYATKDFCLSFLLVCWEVGATQLWKGHVVILTKQSHHHTDESQQNRKTNKKKPTQTSAGKAENAETEVEFCLPLEPKVINFKIHFTVAVYFDDTFLSYLPQFGVMNDWEENHSYRLRVKEQTNRGWCHCWARLNIYYHCVCQTDISWLNFYKRESTTLTTLLHPFWGFSHVSSVD